LATSSIFIGVFVFAHASAFAADDGIQIDLAVAEVAPRLAD
jgi:hypothetical protein